MMDQELWNGSALDAVRIDRLLARYNSPYAGKGALIASVAQREGINPIVILAIMQEESAYGNVRNVANLKPENIANPFSIHFNPDAHGIAKLRLPTGEMPTFEQSLDGAVEILKVAKTSPTPLAFIAKHFAGPDITGWMTRVRDHFETQKRLTSAR